MATIKLKTTAASPGGAPAQQPSRAPVRGVGAGVRIRPTLAQAQDQRVEREAQYQEQLRQRSGDRPPPADFNRRDEGNRAGQGTRPNFRDARNSAPPAHRDMRDSRDNRGNRDNRNAGDNRDNRDSRDSRDNRSAPQNRVGQVSHDNRDTRDTRVNHDNRDFRDTRPRPAPGSTFAQNNRDSRSPRVDYDNRDNRDSRDSRDVRQRPAPGNTFSQDNRDQRSPRVNYDNRDNRATQSNQGNWDNRDSRDNRANPSNQGNWDNRNNRDSRDSHDPRDARQRPGPANQAFAPRQDNDFAPRRNVAPGPSRDNWQPAPSQPAQRPPAQALRKPFQGRDDDDDDYFEHVVHPPGSMRLSKRMSELGIASRREADEWIGKGWVRVDDQIVSALGSRVMPGQRVTIDAKAKYMQAQKVTVLINKPVGYVSGQAEDGYEPAVVLVTPAYQWDEDHSGTRFLREHTKSLVPAGRLDIDSVGLLVLTQDGRVAKQLIGEDSDIEKEYLVRVASAEPAEDGGVMLSDSNLELLRHGLELDGEALLPATVEWINADQLRFVLKQGKKRQLRRMCEAVGLQVLGLKRVRIGKIMLGDLPTGQWRYLRMDEGFI